MWDFPGSPVVRVYAPDAGVDGSELGSGPWVLACTSAQGSFLSKSGPEKVVLAEKLQRS